MRARLRGREVGRAEGVAGRVIRRTLARVLRSSLAVRRTANLPYAPLLMRECRRTHPDMLLKNNVWRQFPGLGTAACIFAAYVVADTVIPEFGGGHGHGDHGHGDHGHGDHGKDAHGKDGHH